MSLREKVVKGIMWAATRNWGRQAINFVFFIILSRLLDPRAFGLVAMASLFTDFIELFLDFGMGDAIVQRAELQPEHLDTAFWTGLMIGTVMLLGGFVASASIANYFKEPQLAAVVKWLSLGFLIGSFSITQIAILKRNLAFKSLAVRSIIATIGGGVVGVVMAYAGYGVWSLVGQTLATGLLGVIMLWSVSNWRPGLRFHPQHFKELFTFGLNVIGINILDFFNKRTDDFLIGSFLGATLLGYYTVAYKLLLVMLQLLTGITTAVAYPTFARLQAKPEKMREAFYKATQYTSLLAFPAFLGMAVVAPEVTLLFFGEKWLASAAVMQILALIGILHAVSLFNPTVLKASGKPSWWLGIMFLTAVVNVIGFRLAVGWGIRAVATAFVVVGYLLSPISILAVRKVIGINIKTYLGQYVAPLIASLAMVLSIVALKSLVGGALNIYARLTIFLLAGAAIYLLAIQVLARTISQEILALIQTTFPNFKIGKA